MRKHGCENQVPWQISLRFLNVEAQIFTDSEKIIQNIAQMYPRFLVEDGDDFNGPLYQFRIILKSENSGHSSFWINQEKKFTGSPSFFDCYSTDLIMKEILTRVQSHFLIHAAVAARGEQGVLISADSGHGKTTLALELVRRGFHYFSDEFAALGRGDKKIHPVPRSLHLRPGTLQLLGRKDFPTPGLYLTDIETLFPGCLGTECRLSHILILKGGHVLPQEDRREKEMGVILERQDRDLFDQVQKIDGVSLVSWQAGPGFPVLRIAAEQRMKVLSQVEKLCQARGIPILDIHKRELTQPNFDGPVRLKPLPHSQAVLELLRQFQPGHESRLLQDEFGSSPARLFMELAEMTTEAQAWELYTGDLHQMADMVESLLQDGEKTV